MSSFLKIAVLVTVFFSAISSASAVQVTVVTPQKLVLSQKGKTNYVIALATDAIPAERTAARELSEYLQKISGAVFPVIDEAEVAESTPLILVGNGTRGRKALPNRDWTAQGTDGIVIKTAGRNLILAGSRPRGTLYAVYTFLEETCKVRWWTATESTIPQNETLIVPPQNIDYTPQLRMREVYNVDMQHDPLFATRLKMNGASQIQGPELGGHRTIVGSVHTFGQLLPLDKYFKEHPEWFSDPASGGLPCTAASPVPVEWQLCLTNDEARRELTKNALQWLKDNPGAEVISISQNDNKVRCTAEADLAIEVREGSPSGPLIHFVNAVAEEIEKQYPNVLVETLAYQYTQKPPRLVKPRRNVVVRLCSVDADNGRPLGSDANADFRDDVLGWRKISSHLAFWDYVANFDMFFTPYPNMPNLGPNIKFFVANKAISVFEQGDFYTNGFGDFETMKAWVLAHLLWDPKLDQRQVEDEFLKGYYGPAAPYLRAYLDGVQNSFLANGRTEKLAVFHSNFSFLTLDVMNSATRSFRQAEAAAVGDSVLLERLRRARLSLDHAWLLRYYSLRRDAARDGKPFEGPSDPATSATAFISSLRNYKVPLIKASQTMEEYAPMFIDRFKPSAPLPEFAQGKGVNDVIDIQENKFRLGMVGTWVTLIDDPNASDGRAARMPGTIGAWAIQSPLEEDEAFLKNGPWHCYIMARVVPKEGAVPGPALNFGVYDTVSKIFTLTSSRSLAELTNDGLYHPIDLGQIDLNPGMYFWVTGPIRDDVEGVYVDRIVLVREPVSTATKE